MAVYVYARALLRSAAGKHHHIPCGVFSHVVRAYNNIPNTRIGDILKIRRGPKDFRCRDINGFWFLVFFPPSIRFVTLTFAVLLAMPDSKRPTIVSSAPQRQSI